MQYIYNEKAGQKELIINDENYKYIAKVRRFKEGDFLDFRNLKDSYLYKYKIIQITKKEVFLQLEEKVLSKNLSSSDATLIWCVIDPKIVQKTLPSLNQIGVKKIVFVYCDRSQRNFKLDLKKYKKILINSNQQCGRVDLMELEIEDSLQDVIKKYKNVAVLDFDGEVDFENEEIKNVLVGCEGGFSQKEKELLKELKKISFKTKNILKSETAAIAILSKLLI